MYYFEEKLDLEPASPETLDKYVAFVKDELLPLWERLGMKLVAAWYSDLEQFSRTTELFEYDTLSAYEKTMAAANLDEDYKKVMAKRAALAPPDPHQDVQRSGPSSQSS